MTVSVVSIVVDEQYIGAANCDKGDNDDKVNDNHKCTYFKRIPCIYLVYTLPVYINTSPSSPASPAPDKCV